MRKTKIKVLFLFLLLLVGCSVHDNELNVSDNDEISSFSFYNPNGEVMSGISVDYKARIENDTITLNIYYGVFDDYVDYYLEYEKPSDWKIYGFLIGKGINFVEQIFEISINDISKEKIRIINEKGTLNYATYITKSISLDSINTNEECVIGILLNNSVDNFYDKKMKFDIYEKNNDLIYEYIFYKVFQISMDNDSLKLDRKIDMQLFINKNED